MASAQLVTPPVLRRHRLAPSGSHPAKTRGLVRCAGRTGSRLNAPAVALLALNGDPMFGKRSSASRRPRLAMVPELLAIYRAHGIPTWEDRVAKVVASIVSTYRRTERDRLAEVASSQRSYSPDDRMTRAEVATFLRISIRNIQRYQKRAKLQPAPRFGRGVVYYFRDVRRCASAIGKER